MENQLAIIVKESGLEPTKAQVMLDNFQDYFAIASEWEKKAKTIVVTNETQEADMKMARIGRLLLREKRIAIEKTRKSLKEQALREGKAIDGIANVLKALIVPIEEYLTKQEKFIEIKKAEKEETERLEAERKAEEERIAQEKAEAEEQERIRLENIRLKEEAEKKERLLLAEREETKRKEELAKNKANAAQEKLKRESDRKLANEKAERQKAEEKAEQERKALEKKRAAEREKEKARLEIERKEKERLEKMLKNQIECPYCHKKFELNKEV